MTYVGNNAISPRGTKPPRGAATPPSPHERLQWAVLAGGRSWGWGVGGCDASQWSKQFPQGAASCLRTKKNIESTHSLLWILVCRVPPSLVNPPPCPSTTLLPQTTWGKNLILYILFSSLGTESRHLTWLGWTWGVHLPDVSIATILHYCSPKLYNRLLSVSSVFFYTNCYNHIYNIYCNVF